MGIEYDDAVINSFTLSDLGVLKHSMPGGGFHPLFITVVVWDMAT